MWGREGVAGSCHGLCVCIIEVIPAACSASHGAFIGGGTLVAVCWGLPCCSLCCYCIWAQLGCQPISLPPSPPASQPWRVARTQLLGSYMQQWCGKCSIMNCFGVPLVLHWCFAAVVHMHRCCNIQLSNSSCQASMITRLLHAAWFCSHVQNNCNALQCH